MSDTTTTPTPADVAPKAQEPAQAPHAPEPTKPEPKPDDTTDWKAEARKWEQRAKDNAKRAEEATKTEAEKVAERLAEVEKRAAEAEARATRRDIALEHKLSWEDAALLDDLTDEAAMKKLAARLASESDKKRNHVPREGNNPETASDDRRDFVRRLTGRS